MHIIYIDDSTDERLTVFSALAIKAERWADRFHRVRLFRHALKESDGIYVSKEFHAWKFVSGRGQIANRPVSKERRCEIFKQTLEMIADIPEVKLFNTVFPYNEADRVFERLLNRINRTMKSWDSYAILICDEGSEEKYTRMANRMRIYNPIPYVKDRKNDTDVQYRNTPLDRIIEDPVFKDSKQSNFIQMSDFCAYALLRRESPLESKNKYGLHQAFELMRSVLVIEASNKDSEGIIRP